MNKGALLSTYPTSDRNKPSLVAEETAVAPAGHSRDGKVGKLDLI